MMKKNAVWTLLILVAAVAALGLPLRASDAPVVTAPAPEQAAPPAASPAEPSQDPGKAELPESDLFTPKPIYVCKAGWCSSNADCQWWYGPDYVCIKQQGASCGQCFAQ
jgi:hypothetical protein